MSASHPKGTKNCIEPRIMRELRRKASNKRLCGATLTIRYARKCSARHQLLCRDIGRYFQAWYAPVKVEQPGDFLSFDISARALCDAWSVCRTLHCLVLRMPPNCGLIEHIGVSICAAVTASGSRTRGPRCGH